VPESTSGYALTAYGEMLLDETRTGAYIAAMEHVIKPGDIVLEIGAGPGVFAMLAAKMGAKRVIAVECNPSIKLAKRLVSHNRLSEKIECIKGLSTDLNMEERADVIISDLRGVLPMFSHHIPSIVDARERLMATDGTLIGRKDIVCAAPVEHDEAHRRIREPWLTNSFGLDLSAGAESEASFWSQVRLRPEQLLAEGITWWEFDYHSVKHPAAKGNLSWEIQRAGRCHGIAAWFDAELAPDIGFSNHPGQPGLIYGQAFMPLRQAIDVESGARINAEIHAYWVNGAYVWRWKGNIYSREGALIDSFDQSSLGRRFQA
jgi:protein arginine N-methyltransferase 1